MKAFILTGPKTTEMTERPIPEIGANDVLMKVRICGVCTAELPIWRSGKWPMNDVLGHEPVGIVERVGQHVKNFAVGDRVTGFCHGSFAEYTKVDASMLSKVPDELEDIEAIGEPMSCMYSAAERTPVRLGETVVIVGLGFMGLGMLQLMRMKGAGRIIAVGKRPEQLEAAKKFGADIAWLPDDVKDPYLVSSGWDFMGKGLPVVVEAAGSASALSLAGDMTGVMGTLSVVGFHTEPRTLNIEMWNKKSLTMINAHERDKSNTKLMDSMMDLIRQKKFNARDMVTHAYSPDEIDQAFSSLISKPEGFIKGYVDFRNFS